MMPPFTIAAAQSSSIRADVAENVRRHAELVLLAKEHGSHVVVFPELSLTGYEPTIAADVAIDANDPALRPLRDLCEARDVAVLAGCPLRSVCERPYIGMLIFRPGRDTGVYRKRFVHSSEEPYFVASDETCVVSVGEMAIGVAICADISHPAHAADAAQAGANVYAAGVAKTPDEIEQASTNMASHAKRHGMLAVMANYAAPTGGFPTGGCSAAWDEKGQRLARAEPHGESLVLARKLPDGWRGEIVQP